MRRYGDEKVLYGYNTPVVYWGSEFRGSGR